MLEALFAAIDKGASFGEAIVYVVVVYFVLWIFFSFLEKKGVL